MSKNGWPSLINVKKRYRTISSKMGDHLVLNNIVKSILAYMPVLPGMRNLQQNMELELYSKSFTTLRTLFSLFCNKVFVLGL